METLFLTNKDEDIKTAAEIIKNGGNVIFPTETVYGLGANAFNKTAVLNIFKAKGRPADNPLIVHISSMDMIDLITDKISDNARKLMDMYWPGPLTVILNKTDNVPYEVTANLNTVAVRMPENPIALKLIKYAGLPIAAPSANISGKPSPTEFYHCKDDMTGKVDAIIDGGNCSVGVESTVIDMSGKTPLLLRPGKVTKEELEAVLGEVSVADSLKSGETPKSPGLKYKHYSPKADVVILSGDVNQVQNYINNLKNKAGMLVFDEFPKFDGVETISLGSNKSPETAAQRLFSALREMDKKNVDIILAPQISEKGVWRAVRNRLYRAAGENIIDLNNISLKQVLFVCTGNTCRSPMAEGLFNKYAKEASIFYNAVSAGIMADNSPASENSVTVMKEIGIDISDKRSVQLNADILNASSLILTMSKSHKDFVLSVYPHSDKVYTLSEYVGESEDIKDPFGQSADVYRECREQIAKLVHKVIEKL